MAISVSTNTLAFGTVTVGDSRDLQVTITATSDTAVTLVFDPTGRPYTVSPASGTATAAGLVVTVKFTPTAAGSVAATTLRVKQGNTTAQNVALTAVGVAATDQSNLGSHLLIKVPDYGDTEFVNVGTQGVVDGGIDASGIDPTSLASYLRLGSFDFASESPAAKALLEIIPGAGPAKNPQTSDPEVEIISGVSGYVFNDDVRLRPQDRGTSLTVDEDPDHKLTKEQRREESARLYARGGWRDHSDGNRISTTWGDKVEVVRGNYKMIVLGRQNNPAQAMGWEAAGGHIQDFAPGTMPGASFWLEWIDDTRYYATGAGGDGRKGAWLLLNTTENVYQFARTAGTLREEKWGDVHESYVGSENPPDAAFAVDSTHGTGGHYVDEATKIGGLNYLGVMPVDAVDQQGKIRSNPHLISKTWARRIDSWTGTPARHVPTIVEKKYADDVTSWSGDADNRIGSIEEHTWAETSSSLTDVSQRIEENTRAGSIFGATTAGTIWEATTTALHSEFHFGGVHMEVELGITHLTLELGKKIDFTIANGFEVKVGPYDEVALKDVKTRLSDDWTAAVQKTTFATQSTNGVLAKMQTVTTKIGAAVLMLGI